jgi:ribulose kinase
MAKISYVIGVDYGTDSVRSIIVDAKLLLPYFITPAGKTDCIAMLPKTSSGNIHWIM